MEKNIEKYPDTDWLDNIVFDGLTGKKCIKKEQGGAVIYTFEDRIISKDIIDMFLQDLTAFVFAPMLKQIQKEICQKNDLELSEKHSDLLAMLLFWKAGRKFQKMVQMFFRRISIFPSNQVELYLALMDGPVRFSYDIVDKDDSKYFTASLIL